MISRNGLFPARAARHPTAALAIAVVTLACSIFVARIASADEVGESDIDTVHPYGHRTTEESPQHFAFEARFGPYRPDIDKQFTGPNKPYQTVFGTDHHLMVGLELDWQALRFPMLGTLGLGYGISYMSASGPAKIRNSSENSGEDTWLKILPMYAVGVLRIDVLARETAVPLVPYVKAGLGYGLWWSGTDLGTTAKGHSAGFVYAVGGMLLLDNFDEDAALQLDNDVGINNTYIFFEWYNSNLNGFGDSSSLRIGASTWALGLAFEI